MVPATVRVQPAFVWASEEGNQSPCGFQGRLASHDAWREGVRDRRPACRLSSAAVAAAAGTAGKLPNITHTAIDSPGVGG